MIRPILLFAICTAIPCRAEPPKLFREKQITCAAIAEAVNHFVALDEKAAVKELEGLTVDWRTDHNAEFSKNERVSSICRIVFIPKEKEPIRQPHFGALSLPDHSMPLKSWPLYPVASAGKSYFILSEGYTLFGHAENPKDYINHCWANGKFRTEKVSVPTKDDALKDLETLHNSDAWKAIKWSDSGPGWSLSMKEDGPWKFIKAQAEATPRK